MARLTLSGNPSSGSHDINVTIVPSANTSQDVTFTLPPTGGTIATVGGSGNSSAVTTSDFTTFKKSVEATLPNKLDKLDDSKSYTDSSIVLLSGTSGDAIKSSAITINSRSSYDVLEIPTLTNSKKLVSGIATDKTDGTAVIGLFGSSTTSYPQNGGLAFASNGTLLWKGNEVLNTSNYTNTVAPKSHTHTISNVTNLQTELNKRVVFQTYGSARSRGTSEPTYGLE